MAHQDGDYSRSYSRHERRDRGSRRSPEDRETWKRSVEIFLDQERRGDERRRDRSRSPRDRSWERGRGDERKGKRDDFYSPKSRRDSPKEDRSSRHSSRSKSRDSSRYEEDRSWDEDSRGRHRSDKDRLRDSDRRDGSGSSYSKRGEWQDDTNYDYELLEYDRFSYKKQTPNRTLIIRGLVQHVTEEDIRNEILKNQLVPKDVRLIRKKDTGASRGFAFVEFFTTREAQSLIEWKRGELMIKDLYRAVMQYSIFVPNEPDGGADWFCKCNARNFKRRDYCYKCGTPRSSGGSDDLLDEISTHPTSTVLLRNLDLKTTEENVLRSIEKLSNLPIRSVRIGKDPVTGMSRGVCYLEMNNVVDAMYLHNCLLMDTLYVNNRPVDISYCKLTPVQSSSTVPSSAANAAIAAAQWSHQKTEGNQYTLEDVNRLAEYSANLYAKTPEEKATYLTYYLQYYSKQISNGEMISLPTTGSSNVATPQVDSSKTAAATPLVEAPTGSGEHAYPIPDVSTYQYDKTSGYYYDPYTTLYYDANSQYYYNSKLTKFLYWDGTRNTYLPAPTSSTVPSVGGAANGGAAGMALAAPASDAEKKEKPEKDDKVKVAKRIAKDMEKWAKTLNHKKEIAKQNLVAAQAAASNTKAQGSADIGFSVLERKEPTQSALYIDPDPAPFLSKTESLVANYGQGSDSEDETAENTANEDKQHTDWVKLACLLCKRQFPSKDVLLKHQSLSDLHKQNLRKWYDDRGLDPDDIQKRNVQYRDRAKERRQKYGEPDEPRPNRYKEAFLKAKEATVSYEEPTKAGIGSDNLGNKLLQKMGWQEGMGLGKKNQGRTTIIEAEQRVATAGLGSRATGITRAPGETYKDCVKKMMRHRYEEICDS